MDLKFVGNCKSYLIDILALVLALLLAVFVKLKVAVLLEGINSYSEVFEGINATDSYVNLLQMEQAMEGFSSLVTWAYILVLVVLPVGLYLLFSLSQGINISLLLKKKIDWKNLLGFVLTGIPFFLVLVYLLNNVFDLLFVYFSSWFSLVWVFLYLVLILVLGFIWLKLGVLIFKKGFIKGVRALSRTLKHILFFDVLYYFGIALTGFVIFLLSFILFARYVTESFFGFDWVWMVLCLLALVVFYGFLRDKFINHL